MEMIETENFPLHIPTPPSVLIPKIHSFQDEKPFYDFEGHEIAANLFDRYSYLITDDPHYIAESKLKKQNNLPTIDTFTNPGDSDKTVKFQEGEYIYSIFTSHYDNIDMIRYCVGRLNGIVPDSEKFEPQEHLEEVIRILIKKSEIEDISFIMTDGFSKEGTNFTYFHNSAAQSLIENVLNFREKILERKN